MDSFRKIVLVNAGLVVLVFVGLLAYLAPFREAQSWKNKCIGASFEKMFNLRTDYDYDYLYRTARKDCGL